MTDNIMKLSHNTMLERLWYYKRNTSLRNIFFNVDYVKLVINDKNYPLEFKLLRMSIFSENSMFFEIVPSIVAPYEAEKLYIITVKLLYITKMEKTYVDIHYAVNEI